MKILSILAHLIADFCLLATLVSCSPENSYECQYKSDDELADFLTGENPHYPVTDFIVLSDLHIYNPILGIEGQAFEDYLAVDRKLLKESTEIMETTMQLIRTEKADFVLIAGDLTKDGERISHETVIGYLTQIEEMGRNVYVVPGNHDINNGHAYRYMDTLVEPVPSISAEEFAELYGEFGYNEALFRDNTSLSYVAELTPGLWLLALDTCLYTQNKPNEEPITDGKLSAATVEWMEEVLQAANHSKKAVIAMLHHSVVEHYKAQEKYFGQYILDEFTDISRMLAAYNVRMVFTGHYHAQDITRVCFDDLGKFVFDIETGSLVTYPCPYRLVNVDTMQKATIRTKKIESIPSHPVYFPDFAKEYVLAGIKNIASSTIQGYKVELNEAEKLADQVAEAVVAHYAGDEYLPPGQEIIGTEGLSLPGRIVVILRKDLIHNQWHDLEPPDNNVTLDLLTGSWKSP